MKIFLVLALLLAVVFVAQADADPCSLRSDVPCVHVPHCDNGSAHINRYYLTTAPSPQLLPARQRTITSVCHNKTGIVVKEDALEQHFQSPWKQCNDPIWKQSNVVEVC